MGYEDVYEVSNMGRVRRSRWGVATYAGRVLKLRRHRDGYSIVFLLSGTHASGRTVFVHRLVAQSFYGPIPEGMEVNHRNGDKTDNRPENLEYVTRSANIGHAFATGLNHSTGVQGSQHYRAKLTEEDVAEIKRLRGIVKGQDLAQRFGVSPGTVSMIQRGHKWKHV